MAIETEPRNAGRRVITQEEADAIEGRAPPVAAVRVRKRRAHSRRR